MRALSELLDVAALNRDIAEGYVSVRPHPGDAELLILNYTQKTQFSGHWTDATRKTRGLIIRDSSQARGDRARGGQSKLPARPAKPGGGSLGSDGFGSAALSDPSAISADALIEELPWAKFFTAEQATLSDWGKIKLVDEESNSVAQDYAVLDMEAPVAMTEKLDGSLAIVYRRNGGLGVATRGSFDGAQARQASAWLRNHAKYPEICRLLHGHEAAGHTFLFEWIGPSNPIVLPYEHDELVFLGTVDKATGTYGGTEQWPLLAALIRPVRAEQAASLAEALAVPVADDTEGYVVRYLGRGIADEIAMIKIKSEHYLRLHHAMYSLTTGNVYTLLYHDGIDAVNHAAQNLPDGIARQIRDYAEKLLADHARILQEAVELNRRIESELPAGYTQKDYASKANPYPRLRALLFLEHSGKAKQEKMSDLAWRMLRPEQSTLLLSGAVGSITGVNGNTASP